MSSSVHHTMLATIVMLLPIAGSAQLSAPVSGPRAVSLAALEHGAVNPRVQLRRAMTEVFARSQYGGNRERGLERWQDAIRGSPWGHAEAWAWLGGAYWLIGRYDDAREALERAVRLKPDSWWARIVMAQGRWPAMK